MLLPGILNPDRGNLLPKDGLLTYVPNFIPAEEASELFDELRTGVRWRQEKIKMYGKVHDVPRLTAWYGDPGKSYTYSAITMHPEPWSPTLRSLKQRIEAETKEDFNSLLINYYRDGGDHVSWHADDERELGTDPAIASLSLGEVRRFQLRHRFDRDLPVVSLDLEPGSLVLMSGVLQTHWLHRISPTKKPLGPRLNLTFRNVRN